MGFEGAGKLGQTSLACPQRDTNQAGALAGFIALGRIQQSPLIALGERRLCKRVSSRDGRWGESRESFHSTFAQGA